jgi:hypothetical protein
VIDYCLNVWIDAAMLTETSPIRSKQSNEAVRGGDPCEDPNRDA